MRTPILAITALLTLFAAGQAGAQYYPPPYGYGPPGSRCNAFFRTPYGPQHVVCHIARCIAQRTRPGM